MPASSPPPLRPLLKWAGGKRQLIETLRGYYPVRFDRYIEPFVGSGAVFFDLLASGRLDGRPAHLCDLNADLIGCYRMVRDHTEDVVRTLSELAHEHRVRGELCYYDVRDRRFNPARVALVRKLPDASTLADRYTPALAAMLLFLNRTGYNGLFRLNRRGAFNVPAGRYANPRICDPEHIRAVGAALRRPGIMLQVAPFDVTLGQTRAGDFVYCDPPYAPLGPTSNFAHYTAEGFSDFDQRRLQAAVVEACGRGARVVVSNSSAPEIVGGYGSAAARAVALNVRRVPARRAINSRASARGVVEELIISNVPVPDLDAIRPRMLAASPRRKMKTA